MVKSSKDPADLFADKLFWALLVATILFSGIVCVFIL